MATLNPYEVLALSFSPAASAVRRYSENSADIGKAAYGSTQALIEQDIRNKEAAARQAAGDVAAGGRQAASDEAAMARQVLAGESALQRTERAGELDIEKQKAYAAALVGRYTDSAKAQRESRLVEQFGTADPAEIRDRLTSSVLALRTHANSLGDEMQSVQSSWMNEVKANAEQQALATAAAKLDEFGVKGGTIGEILKQLDGHSKEDRKELASTIRSEVSWAIEAAKENPPDYVTNRLRTIGATIERAESMVTKGVQDAIQMGVDPADIIKGFSDAAGGSTSSADPYQRLGEAFDKYISGGGEAAPAGGAAPADETAPQHSRPQLPPELQVPYSGEGVPTDAIPLEPSSVVPPVEATSVEELLNGRGSYKSGGFTDMINAATYPARWAAGQYGRINDNASDSLGTLLSPFYLRGSDIEAATQGWGKSANEFLGSIMPTMPANGTIQIGPRSIPAPSIPAPQPGIVPPVIPGRSVPGVNAPWPVPKYTGAQSSNPQSFADWLYNIVTLPTSRVERPPAIAPNRAFAAGGRAPGNAFTK